MANIYKSNYTGEQIDNSVGLTQENTATQGQVLTANGIGGASWQDASIGTEVIANPIISGSESELTGLEVNGTKYKIPEGGVEVVANPSLTGTESDLTGLEVNGTKYKIPSGGGKQLYSHNIVIQISSGNFLVEGLTNIINDTNTAFNYTSLHNYVYNLSTSNHSRKLITSGSIYNKSNSKTYNITGLGENGSGKLTAVYFEYNGTYFESHGVLLDSNSLYIRDMIVEI